ncbi:MAG: DUF6463 family protein [Kangiellaceae bacterium]|nr:DUF6463 family protein [Kangiellaceae bacterium]MCW8998797.1 DUF6463 family protein [Kangiellaceae bacterium]MCW9018405.1 DUF6463 family protein [Kangiellaceae bacterium]
MKTWKSTWIMGVAILHTIYALIVFSADYLSLIENNWIASITSARAGLAVWFFLFGQALFIIGQLVRSSELKGDSSVALSVTAHLLVMTILGVTIMPESGFWLMFPPLIAMLITKTNAAEPASA